MSASPAARVGLPPLLTPESASSSSTSSNASSPANSSRPLINGRPRTRTESNAENEARRAQSKLYERGQRLTILDTQTIDQEFAARNLARSSTRVADAQRAELESRGYSTAETESWGSLLCGCCVDNDLSDDEGEGVQVYEPAVSIRH